LPFLNAWTSFGCSFISSSIIGKILEESDIIANPFSSTSFFGEIFFWISSGKISFAIFPLIIFFELIIVIGGWNYKPDFLDSIAIEINTDLTNTQSLGSVIYTDYIHLFQLSGMILLVAMIGAIVLTFRQRSGVKRQSYFKQISRDRKDGIELVDVENNKGVKIDA